VTDTLDIAAAAAACVTIEVRTPYETVLAKLEEQYMGLQRRLPNYDDVFRSAWKSVRETTLDEAGWTELNFYAEMDRRRLHLSDPES